MLKRLERKDQKYMKVSKTTFLSLNRKIRNIKLYELKNLCLSNCKNHNYIFPRIAFGFVFAFSTTSLIVDYILFQHTYVQSQLIFSPDTSHVRLL